MATLEIYFIIFLIIQFFHSIEELTNKFHKKFPFGKLKFKNFFLFEVLFLAFWLSILILDQLKYRNILMSIFILLMFANGIWHIVWWRMKKKYVPGIFTAPWFVIVFLFFYFQTLF